MFLSISNIGFSPGSSITGENPEQFLLTGMHMRWLTETGSQGQQVFNQTRHARPRRELGSRQKAKPRRCKSASLHGDGGCGTRCPGGVWQVTSCICDQVAKCCCRVRTVHLVQI